MTEEAKKIYDSMLAAEKERFGTISRKLMSQCMLVRDKNSVSRDDYVFISKPDNMLLLRETLYMLGYDAAIDRDAGVVRVYVPGDDTANRYNLSIRAKIILCCLLLLYIEKLQSRSILDRNIMVSVSDIIDILEKYRLKDRIGSDSALKECLPVLARFNLIAVGCAVKDISASTPVYIYPSIQFCLDESALKDFIKGTEELLESEAQREKDAAMQGLKDAVKEEDDNEQ